MDVGIVLRQRSGQLQNPGRRLQDQIIPSNIINITLTSLSQQGSLPGLLRQQQHWPPPKLQLARILTDQSLVSREVMSLMMITRCPISTRRMGRIEADWRTIDIDGHLLLTVSRLLDNGLALHVEDRRLLHTVVRRHRPRADTVGVLRLLSGKSKEESKRIITLLRQLIIPQRCHHFTTSNP